MKVKTFTKRDIATEIADRLDATVVDSYFYYYFFDYDDDDDDVDDDDDDEDVDECDDGADCNNDLC